MELRKPMITESQLNILHRQIRPIMNAIKEIFPNKSGQKVGPGKAWNFPKFHKLCELEYSIFKWGMLLNTSCQTGERAHTALTKKSYLKTNFKNSNKQMLERYLRRVGSLRRTEYAAKHIELNRNTSRLRWDSLDPRWRTRRQQTENKSARVQYFQRFLHKLHFVYHNFMYDYDTYFANICIINVNIYTIYVSKLHNLCIILM